MDGRCPGASVERSRRPEPPGRREAARGRCACAMRSQERGRPRTCYRTVWKRGGGTQAAADRHRQPFMRMWLGCDDVALVATRLGRRC